MPEPSLLPAEFADLERFAQSWALRTERERYAQRLSSTMDELQAFYDAAMPRAEEAKKYLDGFELSELSGQQENLLLLLYSLVSVSFPIECYKQPSVPDTGSAYLDLVEEPVP